MAKRKRPVTLTLDADVVARARMSTDDLSTFVESLLADYIAREQRRRITEANVARETVATWTRFAESTVRSLTNIRLSSFGAVRAPA